MIPGSAMTIPNAGLNPDRQPSIRPPKLAVLSAYFAEQGGGVEMTTGELVDALRAAGIGVEWTAMGPRAARDHQTHAVAGTDILNRLFGVPMPIPMPWALPAVWSSIRRADLVVAVEANFLLSAAGFLVAKLLGRPTLLIQHIGKPSTVSLLARIVMTAGERLVVRPILRSADRVIGVSPVVTDHFSRDRSDMLEIGHPIDTALFRPARDAAEVARERQSMGLPSSGRIACFVGRLTESKGIAVVIEMARRLPEWSFAIAGAGPVDVTAAGLPNILPLGQLTREGVASLYRASDVTVLASPSESFSLVVRESLAAGVRVLCADQIFRTDAQLARFVESAAVELDDVPATAHRFVRLLQQQRSTPAERGRAYVEQRCGFASTHGAYIALIAELASKAVEAKR